MKTEIELTKYGEVVILEFEVWDEGCGEFNPITIQRFSEDTGEPLPIQDAGDLNVTNYIQQQLVAAVWEARDHTPRYHR